MIRTLLVLVACGCGVFPAQAETAPAFHIPSLYHVGYWVRDVAKSRAFYSQYLGFAEPYVLNTPAGKLQMVVMKVNERQVIYLFNNAAKIRPNGDNLDHLGLETDNAAALRDRIVAHGIKAGGPHPGRIGDLILTVKDPDGHVFEITQFEPAGQLLRHQGQSLPSTRVSQHLRSANVTVADLAASLRFYRDVLGFKVMAPETGGPAGSVRVRVPDGSDFLRLVPATGDPAKRAVPEYCLEVADADRTAAFLAARASVGGFPAPGPVVAEPDGSRQTSCIDPDGTRVVFRSPPGAE